jgi:hypothetical protein
MASNILGVVRNNVAVVGAVQQDLIGAEESNDQVVDGSAVCLFLGVDVASHNAGLRGHPGPKLEVGVAIHSGLTPSMQLVHKDSVLVRDKVELAVGET